MGILDIMRSGDFSRRVALERKDEFGVSATASTA
jgi:methyl-accepting chemotaxis protein WspA